VQKQSRLRSEIITALGTFVRVFTEVCKRMGLQRRFQRKNRLPHSSHLKVSARCRHTGERRRQCRADFVVKSVPHLAHLCGISPQCVREWVLSVDFIIKLLPHSSHLKVSEYKKTMIRSLQHDDP